MAVAERILLNYATPVDPSDVDRRPDPAHENIRLLLRDLIYVAELTQAIADGDFGGLCPFWVRIIERVSETQMGQLLCVDNSVRHETMPVAETKRKWALTRSDGVDFRIKSVR